MFSRPNYRRSFAIVILGLLLVNVLVIAFYVQDLRANPDTFLSGWSYRQSHTISYSGSLSDYQMYFNVYKGSGTSSGNNVYLNNHCVSFPNDLNFTDSSNNYYKCWMEDSNSTWAKIWVKITSLPTTMYIYYGNSMQTSFGSNGDATFVFFDDFNGASVDWTNKWTSGSQGSYSIVSGQLKCTLPSDNTGFIRSKNSYGESNCLTFKVEMSSSSSYSFYGTYGDNPANFYYTSAVVGYWPGDTTGGRLTYARSSGRVDTQFTISANQWQSVDLEVKNANIKNTVMQGSTTKGSQSASDAVYGYSRYVKFLHWMSSQYTLVDFVYLRKSVDGVSHGDWGSEQFPLSPKVNSVYLNSPNYGATKTTWSVDFKYTPVFYQPIVKACLWTNKTGVLARTQWNTLTVLNDTQNTISYTFNSEGTYLWNVEVFNSTASVFASTNLAVTVDTPPRDRNVGSNTTSLTVGSSVLLYGQGNDGIGLDKAWLATNETGIWYNYTAVDYTAQVKKAINWIARAQDAIPGTGGVSDWFDISSNSWASEDYDEVTGYTIQTVYDWADYTNNATLHARAKTMADWLVSLIATYSPPDGPWRNVYAPSMMELGLLRAYEETNDAAYKQTAIKIGDWLVAVQSADGTWTGSVSYYGIPHTYDCRTDWALLWLWKTTGNSTYKDYAIKNLNWALRQQLSNGWFNNDGMTSQWDATTHTIGYTIMGLFQSGNILNNQTIINACKKAANALLSCQKSDGSLTGGEYQSDWTAIVTDQMLTGTAQICDTWLELYKYTGNTTWLNAAQKMNAYLVTKQGASSNPGINGGLPGSDPITGFYMPNMIPAWATKFLTDSLYHQTITASVLDMKKAANTWTWSNFTWHNPTIPPDTTVGWKIWYQDTYGNLNSTGIMTFNIAAGVIESSNSAGATVDQFNPGVSVYAKGNALKPNSTYQIYIVKDYTSWAKGTTALTQLTVIVGPITVSTDAAGNIIDQPKQLWTSAIPGYYDIFADCQNSGTVGTYDAYDAVDRLDVGTAGFFVVPEYALGTILALAVCFAGVIVYRRSKRTRL
jgi:hypothetical protein